MSIPSWSSGQANAWLLLARCHLAAKNHDEAQMSCREAHALCEETKNFQQELEVWQQVGRIQKFTSKMVIYLILPIKVVIFHRVVCLHCLPEGNGDLPSGCD